MTRSLRPRLPLFLSLGIALVFGAAADPAQAQSCEPQVARATSVQGTVEMRRGATASWQPVKLNDAFCPGDTIRVQERSRADVTLLDQSVLRLNAGATFTVQAVKDQRTGVIELLQGAAHFFSRGPRSLEVQTPFTVAGVRGTEFYVNVEPDRTLITVFEGTVAADNAAGSLALASGQSAVAERGKAPVTQIVARPRDAVQWTLYYPAVVYFRPDEFPAGPDWPGAVRASLEASAAGDLQQAFDRIATVPATVSDARFYAHRASLLLAVGRVDEASADIQRALSLRGNDPNALALQSIILVAQNDKDGALQVAQQAVQAAPDSGAALIAQSYAQQARFDLAGARASLEEAVKREPQNALAWARLAEIHSSFGDTRKSLEAAQRAAALQPNLARTQTVLGFAYLTEVKTREAREAFEKAITLDQADPLPRLGLGLAKIRDGRLNEGGREIEVAASLDPSNAIVRSYLGKTYYEEKRGPLDEREYSVAKELDPKDPTPWFYNAIAKQTTNRPVEALRDLEKAIELNDNRAVYRSRLLLESDEAARSASLGRIYTDLGFQQLALVEGWKSVNTDPSNYSAHRFLADSYSVLPRHEIARVSELLQSQLLQPTNINPIQPRLAESSLFLISSGGPGTLSFNEFNPLFERNRMTALATGLVGEHETYGGEIVVAGIYDRVSFSLGYTHFETDGFRDNADQKDNLVNVFLQYELTSQTSAQIEYRYRKNEYGDLALRFFDENVFPGLRNTEEVHTIRLGARHAFSPGSILLGSFMYQDSQIDATDTQSPALPPDSLVDTSRPETSYSFELQHLLRTHYFNLTSGGGYFNVDGSQRVTVTGLPEPIDSTLDRDLDHANLYAYSYLNFLKDVVFTLGLSLDILRSDTLEFGDKTEPNPKFGVTWEPLPGTTLRAAAFRVLKRTLITDQTLEPTQVAGFNQFFDDMDGTESWVFGGAIDQKFGRDVFAGVQYSYRDLTVPFVDFTDPAAPDGKRSEDDWIEHFVRTYVFWTPHPWVALGAQFLWERYERDDAFNSGISGFSELDTYRVPLRVGFFHPSGFSASVTGTYWYQTGDFENFAQPGAFQSGSDNFWTVDMAIGYRLPKRFGFITVGVTNLLDTSFGYFDVDFKNPAIQPERTVFARLTLAFP
jgi:tetratricopeptide (TPR) repeat protein